MILEGYDIDVTTKEVETNYELIQAMDREALKDFLSLRKIKFFNGADDQKLRELALQHI